MVEAVGAREAYYNEQVARLRAYLEAGGVQLKHRNAQEAVAQMHGFKDWHSLKADKGRLRKAPGDEAAPHEEKATKGSGYLDVYAIQALYGGNSDVSVAASKDVALLGFVQKSRTFVDLFGGDRRVTVLGQDVDDGLPYLALALDDTVVVTLERPATIVGTTVKKGSDGSGKVVDVPRGLLGPVETSESWYAVAVALTEAFASRKRSEEKPRLNRAMNSKVAMEASIETFDAMSEAAIETKKRGRTPLLEVDPRGLLMGVDKVQTGLVFMATVRGDSDHG